MDLFSAVGSEPAGSEPMIALWARRGGIWFICGEGVLLSSVWLHRRGDLFSRSGKVITKDNLEPRIFNLDARGPWNIRMLGLL
jgi:hypothetical protein